MCWELKRLDKVSSRLFRFGGVRLLCRAGVMLALIAAVVPGCQRRIDRGPPNVVIILIDTLRPDHLGCYGYPRETSPNLDRLAGGGTIFWNAVAQSSWTLPSAASLLTGLYPTRHQAINKSAVLPLHRETLAEVLHSEGYRTAAVVSHTLVSSDYNLDQGFELFDETHISGHLEISSPGVTDVATRWLRENGETPFFLFLHYFDPHYAYLEHEGFVFPTSCRGRVKADVPFHTIQMQRRELGQEGVECLMALYDSEIAFTDYHIGVVLEELRRLGLEESTMVVVTGDHGEEFMEHGWLGHTVHLYEETVRVPMILCGPGMRRAPQRVNQLVELVDVMPTLLDLLGIDRDPATMDGRSFRDALDGKEQRGGRAFSEVGFDDVFSRLDRNREPSRNPNLRAVRSGSWKLILDPVDRRWEFYDLAADPGERVNLAAMSSDERFTTMKQWMVVWMNRQDELALRENTAPDTLRVLDEETRERLKALGYIN
ncbi:MAG: sulfatase [Candidatus Eisenbacteria sp.]|nr:sulfatase [Candidatus Eisenbacteria bacterium]